MKVDLGLLDINKLPRASSSQGNHDGQSLGDAESYVGDADKVSSTTLFGTWHAADLKLNMSISNAFRLDFPRESKKL